mgnify:CR=1 FL=1
MPAVTEHQFEGGTMWSYDDVLYDKYEDIPFKTKEQYEAVKSKVGTAAKATWDTIGKIPHAQGLLKDVATGISKGVQYIDQVQPENPLYGLNVALDTLKFADEKLTQGSEFLEKQTGIYAPTTKVVSELAIDYLASGGAGKIAKGSKMLANQGDNLVRKLTPQLAYETVPVEGLFTSAVRDATSPGFNNSVFASTTTARGISKAEKATQRYKDWTTAGKDYYYKNITKDRPMAGFEKFIAEDTGEAYTLSTTKKTGKIIDGVEERGLGPVSKSVRNKRNLKRAQTTKIPVEEVELLAKKYKQPPEIVQAFMKDQKLRKKKIDDAIAKINKRIKANPGYYSKDFKASLGHGKAAERYLHSADIASNLDIENFLTNISRSNKDEISDYFNRSLGRSIDLEEEFLKFVDPDLGKFHELTFGLKRQQKEIAIEYVRNRMNNKIDWKSHKAPTGEQLFKSKEEYLINEALDFVTSKKKKTN